MEKSVSEHVSSGIRETKDDDSSVVAHKHGSERNDARRSSNSHEDDCSEFEGKQHQQPNGSHEALSNGNQEYHSNKNDIHSNGDVTARGDEKEHSCSTATENGRSHDHVNGLTPSGEGGDSAPDTSEVWSRDERNMRAAAIYLDFISSHGRFQVSYISSSFALK